MSGHVSASEKKAVLDFATMLSTPALAYLHSVCGSLLQAEKNTAVARLAGNAAKYADENYVGRLQEHCAKAGYALPTYQFAYNNGKFGCVVRLDTAYEIGAGLPLCTSKAAAKRQAAKEALAILHNHGVLDDEVASILGWHQNQVEKVVFQKLGGSSSASSESDMDM